MTHSPGPWFQSESGTLVKTIRIELRHDEHVRWPIANVHVVNDVGRANARLIAAAPKMLEALKEAADIIQELDGGNPQMNSGWATSRASLLVVWQRIRAAIAEAEGK